MKRNIMVKKGDTASFHNQVDFCVGTGRMGLALQKEYMEQLKLVQEYIGFKHIRGHGLFTDDMAIYQEREENGERIVEYNYTYLDLVMDGYLELGLTPFLELGFMPEKMASGTQTIFYWKGNTTPPKDYKDWQRMIQALLRHLMDRYGKEEVLTWPIEVWNEPNLPGFWEHADMEEYFKLFRHSFDAIKEVDERFRVGGPAVCGGTDEKWISAFMKFCHEEKIPLDFVTRHHYTTDFPERVGHYGYAELMDEEEGFANLKTTRDIIDAYPEYKGLEIHITEFNTSYIPNCPLHDTNQNAAYIAKQLSRLGDGNESYSYWTFGDIFEEQGVPFTPFHGGFGLVANGCIPKPTFWSFAFFKKLKEKECSCVYKDDNCVIIRTADGEFRGVTWNNTRKRAGNTLDLEICLETVPGEYFIEYERVDEKTCNPLKVWHDMGEPANPSRAQTRQLQMAAYPAVSSERQRVDAGGLKLTIPMEEHAVVYFSAKPAPLTPDRGYDYNHVMQYEDVNPITAMDYPDADVIRVEDTYYMVSTSMHFMPGCEILRSYDLIHWEHAAYVYDKLDSTPAQRLEGEENIYGKGMWAASLRYHNGMFYVVFVANDTHKTYLYTAKDVEGPWKKSNIDGFYHDSSLLFDDDGRIFIAYGNRQIYITELKPDLSGPLEGGLHRLAVEDTKEALLGYEGSHFYKINGKYYLFFIHSLATHWRRVESCFVADSIDGEFVGGDVFNDDRGYCGQGIAQGGIVDTPDGDWYAMLFQDSGAVGRMPILVPMHFEEDKPVLGVHGKLPVMITTKSTRPDYEYASLYHSDDFKGELKSQWQFNHEPDEALIAHDKVQGIWTVTTDKVTGKLTQAKNTLTQRMHYPHCAGEVTLNGEALKDGDYAGLCVLQGGYGMIGLTRQEGKLWLVMHVSDEEQARVAVSEPMVRLRLDADFAYMRDEARYSYFDGETFRQLGPVQKLAFRLDHFTGARFGLCVYSTREAGGSASFSDFRYIV